MALIPKTSGEEEESGQHISELRGFHLLHTRQMEVLTVRTSKDLPDIYGKAIYA